MAIIRRKRSWCGRRSMADTPASQGDGRTVPDRGGRRSSSLPIVVALPANLTITEKDQRAFEGRPEPVRVGSMLYPRPEVRRQRSRHRAADTRPYSKKHSGAGRTNPIRINPEARHFATTTVGCRNNALGRHRPENRCSIIPYGDAVSVITEKKGIAQDQPDRPCAPSWRAPATDRWRAEILKVL